LNRSCELWTWPRSLLLCLLVRRLAVKGGEALLPMRAGSGHRQKIQKAHGNVNVLEGDGSVCSWTDQVAARARAALGETVTSNWALGRRSIPSMVLPGL
jgi:hypothetical protein